MADSASRTIPLSAEFSRPAALWRRIGRAPAVHLIGSGRNRRRRFCRWGNIAERFEGNRAL